MTGKTDLGPLPTVHPRHEPVEKARRELDDWVYGWRLAHELTLSEELALLSELLHEKLEQCVRSERRSR